MVLPEILSTIRTCPLMKLFDTSCIAILGPFVNQHLAGLNVNDLEVAIDHHRGDVIWDVLLIILALGNDVVFFRHALFIHHLSDGPIGTVPSMFYCIATCEEQIPIDIPSVAQLASRHQSHGF